MLSVNKSTTISGDCYYPNGCVQQFAEKSQELYSYTTTNNPNVKGDIIVSLSSGRGFGELYIIWKIFTKIQQDKLFNPIANKEIRYPKKIIFFDPRTTEDDIKRVLRFMFIIQLLFKTGHPIMCYYFTDKQDVIDQLTAEYHISYMFGLNIQGTFCDALNLNNISVHKEDTDVCYSIYGAHGAGNYNTLKVTTLKLKSNIFTEKEMLMNNYVSKKYVKPLVKN